ncbi:MAG: cytochrome C, partial [Gammaproteobacteria bacterium]|nr:cytochrome C [Gammaproteobacteria bacterium]
MSQLRPVSIRLILLLFVMVANSNAVADTFESLLMPGPVTTAHEKYEMDCDQCHDTASKDKQSHLCVQCHDHENILDDLSNKTGFHGRLSRSEQDDCKHCHAEHEGRNADIVLLNLSTFNHQKTDFELEGAHEK